MNKGRPILSEPLDLTMLVKSIQDAERARLAELIHYPDCWDTAAYPTFEDALKEIGCNQADCCKETPELFLGTMEALDKL